MMASRSFGSRLGNQANEAKSKATKRSQDARKRIVGLVSVCAVGDPQSPCTLSRMEASSLPETSLNDFSALDAMGTRGKACKDDGSLPPAANQHKWKQACWVPKP